MSRTITRLRSLVYISVLAAAVGCAGHPIGSNRVAPGGGPANFGFYRLATGGASVTVQRDKAGNITLSASPVVFGDPTQTFAIHYDQSAFSSDTLTVARESNGLLRSVSLNSADETGPIIVAAARLAASVATLAAGVPAGPPVTTFTIPPPPAACTPPATPKPAKVQTLIAPGSFAEIGTAFGFNDDKCLIVSVDAVANPQPVNSADCVAYSTDTTLSGYKNGLFYRALGESTVSLASGSPRSTIRATRVPLPFPHTQLTDLGCIPIRRFDLVTTETKIDFEHGAPSTVTLKKPSTALAAVRLPLDVITAILEAPASILTLKVNNVTQETALIEAIAAQQKALEAATAEAAQASD